MGMGMGMGCGTPAGSSIQTFRNAGGIVWFVGGFTGDQHGDGQRNVNVKRNQPHAVRVLQLVQKP